MLRSGWFHDNQTHNCLQVKVQFRALLLSPDLRCVLISKPASVTRQSPLHSPVGSILGRAIYVTVRLRDGPAEFCVISKEGSRLCCKSPGCRYQQGVGTTSVGSKSGSCGVKSFSPSVLGYMQQDTAQDLIRQQVLGLYYAYWSFNIGPWVVFVCNSKKKNGRNILMSVTSILAVWDLLGRFECERFF